MFIYEVNLDVDEEIKFGFAGWLTDHIQAMLTNDGFKVAYWFFRRPEDEGLSDTTKTLWTIQYVVEDRKSLDAYLSGKAEAMRKETLDRFGDKFAATRRVLNLLSAAGQPFDEIQGE